MLLGVPTMLQLLLRQPDATRRDLSAWRTGLFGAAPMPVSAVQQLVTTWPQVNFMQLCGLTEGGPSGIYSDVGQVKARPDASGRQALLSPRPAWSTPSAATASPAASASWSCAVRRS